MSIATRYHPRYTVADYEQWEGDWELWAGYPVAMTPSSSFDQQQVLFNLAFALKTSLSKSSECDCKVVVEVDWRIAEDTVVRPDVMVVCKPITTKWVEITPALIAEVLSPSTQKNDQTFKRSLYAEQGVNYYFIVDPGSQKIEALKLNDGEYQPTDLSDVTLDKTCRISIDTESIWS